MKVTLNTKRRFGGLHPFIDRISADGWYENFDVETCDKCGRICEAANSMKIKLTDRDVKMLGLTLRKRPDSDLGVYDGPASEEPLVVCNDCYGDLVRKEEEKQDQGFFENLSGEEVYTDAQMLDDVRDHLKMYCDTHRDSQAEKLLEKFTQFVAEWKNDINIG